MGGLGVMPGLHCCASLMHVCAHRMHQAEICARALGVRLGPLWGFVLGRMWFMQNRILLRIACHCV